MGLIGAKMDMAQSNVAREPSMDEILASIRKIIESNELESVGISRETPVDPFEEVVSFVSEPVSAPAPVAARVEPVMGVAEPEATKSMSLADIAARVRNASEQRYAENTAPAVDFPPLSAPVTRATDPDPQSAPIERRGEPKAISLLPEKSAEPLLSDMSGQQVARSFSDLAAAMSSSQRRTFDEIAEDMLRPMLTEWLDDNLPKLVERLVREEIERVARGPRR